jgi:hypothetical protein
MKDSHVKWAARILVTIGIVTILGEVVRNWIWNHPIESWVVAIGSGFGFFGFYLMDAKSAKDAFAFAIDNGVVKVVDAVRLGRRKTDPVIPVVPVTAVTPAPDAAALGTPTKPEEVP